MLYPYWYNYIKNGNVIGILLYWTFVILWTIMSVMRRVRYTKIALVVLGLWYFAYMNYQRVQNIRLYVSSNNKIPSEQKHNVDESYEAKNWFKESEIIKRTFNCETYFQKVPAFVMNQIIQGFEEMHLNTSIQIAFSHMLHNHVAIYEAFLAMYFRPYNYYCVHVDYKALEVVRQAVEGIVKCYAEKVTTETIFVLHKKDSIEVKCTLANVI